MDARQIQRGRLSGSSILLGVFCLTVEIDLFDMIPFYLDVFDLPERTSHKEYLLHCRQIFHANRSPTNGQLCFALSKPVSLNDLMPAAENLPLLPVFVTFPSLSSSFQREKRTQVFFFLKVTRSFCLLLCYLTAHHPGRNRVVRSLPGAR
jgi:hypothetical protein